MLNTSLLETYTKRVQILSRTSAIRSTAASTSCRKAKAEEPVGKAVQVRCEGAEAADRFRIAVRSNRRYAHGGTDVDRGRVGRGPETSPYVASAIQIRTTPITRPSARVVSASHEP
jgi:hypothetical protein